MIPENKVGFKVDPDPGMLPENKIGHLSVSGSGYDSGFKKIILVV